MNKWFGLPSSAAASNDIIRTNSQDEEVGSDSEDDDDSYSGFRRRADDGASFTASKCPHDSGLENSCEMPFGFVWTPMAVYKTKQSDDTSNDSKGMSIIQCDSDALPPVLCLACLAYINPFAEIDFATGIWGCPLCGQENVVPKNQLRDGSEIMIALQSPFVEYRQATQPDRDEMEEKMDKNEQEASDYCTYLLVVDENLSPKDGQAIAPAMEAIIKEHSSVGPDGTFPKTRIGLIVFGKSASMYQLGLSGLASADIYVPAMEDDDEEFDIDTERRVYLAEVEPEDNLTSLKKSLSSIFGVAVEENSDVTSQTSTGTLSSRLAMLSLKKAARLRKEENNENKDLNMDTKSPWTKLYEESLSGHPKRCTGEALQCAIDLANGDISNPSRTTRIVLFTNGCPNSGDGNVVKGVSQMSRKKRGKRPTHDIVDTDMLQKAVEYFDMAANFAISVGIGIDVFCCGVTELALPAYQAMVEPSGGYVMPLVSFDIPQLEQNLKFILQNSYISRSMNIPEEIFDNLECILDIRSDSFVTPTQLCGSGKVLPDFNTEMVENERSAFEEGSKLAAEKGFKTSNLPSSKAMELSMTRIQLGRVDPLCTITVMMEIGDSISEEDDYAFFQLVSRYVCPKGNEEITRICSFKLPVAEDINDFVSSIDDEAMSVVLAKVAVYRSLHGREETSDTRDLTVVRDADTQEKLEFDTQLDIDATVQRISGAFRLLGLEEKTRSYSRRPKSKSGSSRRTSESSLDFAFPPQMKETLNRLYHLRRGPLISPGPMRSIDDRAESRGLFLRFPLEDCLQMIRPTVWSTGSMDGVSSAWDKMLPFPAETLSLWDDSIVAADFHDTLFIWSGVNCTAKRYDGIREKFKTHLLEASTNRFPKPELHVLEDGDSMSRRFTARLAPSHADPIDNQIVHFPSLSTLKPEAIEKLRSKFKFYDSKSDASFRTWFWSVASASNNSRLDGMSLCE
mmetsp:Transcript_23585/g.25117  ORF Transcript_23585/g.25117 Transcript_23585/m.25117 type:complete len:964 (-) Transcript_23585:2914-5805(-)